MASSSSASGSTKPLLREPGKSSRVSRYFGHNSNPLPQEATSLNVPEDRPASSQSLNTTPSRTTRIVTSLFEQVTSVRDIAAKNVESLLKREEDLVELERKTESIEESADNFKKVAQKMGNRYEKKNRTMMFALGGTILVAVVVIVIFVVFISLK